MEITRNQFVGSLAIGAAAALTSRSALAGVFVSDGSDVFKPHVGSTFHLTGEGHQATFTLDSVLDVPSCEKTHQFSLELSADRYVPAGTYDVRHAKLGSFQMFVAHVSSKDRSAYVAPFNLLR